MHKLFISFVYKLYIPFYAQSTYITKYILVLTRIFFPNTHFDGNNVKEPSKIVGAMRKFYRPYLFKWKWLLIALVLLSVYLYSRSHNITSHLDTLLHEQVEVAEDEFIKCSVIRVVDGDTFHCRLPDGKDEKVRLVGIDTPEIERNPKAIMDAGRSGQDLETIVSLGKKAANFTKSYLKPGTTVKLELVTQPRDKYGRLLAYVYLSDETMLKTLLVREVYAQVMTIPPNVKFQYLFLKLQREAREQGKGLWGR